MSWLQDTKAYLKPSPTSVVNIWLGSKYAAVTCLFSAQLKCFHGWSDSYEVSTLREIWEANLVLIENLLSHEIFLVSFINFLV